MEWIIPCDLDYYDAKGAFEKLKQVDWRQHNRFSIDDIVYIYASAPYQRIMFKTRVIDVDLSYDQVSDDKEFWRSSEDEEDAKKKRRYVRLQLIRYMDSETLNIKSLIEHGLKKAPQGAVKCEGDRLKLGAYINSCFEENNQYNDGIEVLEENDVYIEGNITTIKVNKYERNLEARRKCIEVHGCKCKICEFNFEKVYGIEGRGLIHVHHIVPISSIKKDYRIDPEKDLIPVCPNCHAMIHRKKEPYTIEEVTSMIKAVK